MTMENLGVQGCYFLYNKACLILWERLQKNEAISLIGLVVFQARLLFVVASSCFVP